MAENVGDIVLDVSADGSGLPAEVRRAAEAATKGVKIQIPADLEEKKLAAKVEATAKALSKIGEVEFTASLDSKRLSAEVAALKRTLGDNFNITNAPTELRSAWSKAAAAARKEAKATKIRIPAAFDFTQAERELAQFRAKRMFTKVDIPIGVETAAAKIDFEAFKRGIAHDAVSVRISAEPDLSSARTASAAMRAAVDDSPIFIPVVTRGRDKGSPINFGSDETGFFDPDRKLTRRINLFFEDLRKAVSKSKMLGAIRLVGRYFAAALSLIVAAIAVALPYIKALGVLLAQTAIQLVSAATAGGVFVAAGFVAIGAAAATAAIGVMGMSTAFQALSKIWAKQDQGLKASKEELKAYKDALKALHPEAAKVVRAVDAMRPAFRQLQQLVQGTLFKGVGRALKDTFSSILPTLRTGFSGIAGVMNMLILRTLTWIKSAEGIKLIGGALDIARSTLNKLGDALGNVAIGLLTLFVGSGDNINTLGNDLVGLTERFKKWAERVTKDGSWKRWLREGRKTLGDLGRIITGIKDIAVGFWQAISGDPNAGVGDAIETIADKFEEWGDWFRDPKNQQAIRDFVDDAKTKLDELATAVLNVAGAINALSGAIEKLSLTDPTSGGEGKKVGLTEWINGLIKGMFPNAPTWLVDADVFINEVWNPFWAEFWRRLVAGITPTFGNNIEIDWGALLRNLFSLTFPWIDVFNQLTDPASEFNTWLTDKFGNGEKITLWDLVKRLFKLFLWDELWDLLDDPAASFKRWFENKFLGGQQINLGELIRRLFRGQNGLPGGANGGSWSIGLNVPVTPVLGPLPRIGNLTPIPWPILPKLGPLPQMPNLRPIPWPILPKFGPLPAYPILLPGLWPIISRWLPIPPHPFIPPIRIPIITKWNPIPKHPFVPPIRVPIITKWAPVPKAPYVAPITVPVRFGKASGGPGDKNNDGYPDVGARGFITNHPQVRLIGEAGPEAVVPLSHTQPLDPGVRALLQAVAADRGMMAQPTAKGKDRIDPTINVNLPTGDPEAAAMSVWNRLVFEGVV
jgi:hypothetical protein